MYEFRLSRAAGRSPRIQYRANGGQFKTISLGKCSETFAQNVLNQLRRGDSAISGLSHAATRKMEAAGIIQVKTQRLDDFLENFLTAYSVGKSSGSIRNLDLMCRHLIECFGERDVTKFTVEDADKWLIWRSSTTSPSTLNREIRYAKMIFQRAVDYGLLLVNPWKHLKAGRTSNDDRFEFVERDRFEKVLSSCPDQNWRVAASLMRYGGIRTTCELFALNWSHIDFENSAITIPKCKTKRRVMPMFPELRRELDQLYDRTGRVAKVCASKSGVWHRFESIVKSSGVKRWPRLFQNLRASRQSELESQGFSQTAVCSWLGNSPMVARQHYLHVLKDDFQRAIA